MPVAVFSIKFCFASVITRRVHMETAAFKQFCVKARVDDGDKGWCVCVPGPSHCVCVARLGKSTQRTY